MQRKIFFLTYFCFYLIGNTSYAMEQVSSIEDDWAYVASMDIGEGKKTLSDAVCQYPVTKQHRINALLRLGARKGNISMVNRALNRGAEIDSPGNDTMAALALAVDRGHKKTVNRLLECRADVNKTCTFSNNSGVSSLIIAMSPHKNKKIRRLKNAISLALLKHSEIDVFRSADGKIFTPAMCASLYNKPELLRLIANRYKKSGKSIYQDCSSENGMNALELATHAGNISCVRTILDAVGPDRQGAYDYPASFCNSYVPSEYCKYLSQQPTKKELWQYERLFKGADLIGKAVRSECVQAVQDIGIPEGPSNIVGKYLYVTPEKHDIRLQLQKVNLLDTYKTYEKNIESTLLAQAKLLFSKEAKLLKKLGREATKEEDEAMLRQLKSILEHASSFSVSLKELNQHKAIITNILYDIFYTKSEAQLQQLQKQFDTSVDRLTGTEHRGYLYGDIAKDLCRAKEELALPPVIKEESSCLLS